MSEILVFLFFLLFMLFFC